MPRIFLFTPAAGSTIIGPISILDGQSLQTLLVSWPSTVDALQLNYTIERNGEVQTGRLLIANDGTDVSCTDDNTDTEASLGVIFDARLNGGNLELVYVSTAMGFPAAFRYSEERFN